MTYREKLKKEHPEQINDSWIGGCFGCPARYGYGPETLYICGRNPNEEKCRKCWDTVIPGTEGDDEYKNLNADELRTNIRVLENRIETKDAVIENYRQACESKNTKLIDLNQKIKKFESENDTLKRTNEFHQKCISELESLVLKRDREIEELNNDLNAEVTENSVAAEKIKELEQQLDKNNEVYRDRIKEKDREIKILKDTVKDREMRLAVYRSQATQTYGTCCCKTDVLAEKDKEIAKLKEQYDAVLKAGAKLTDELSSATRLREYWHRLYCNVADENFGLHVKIDGLEIELEKEKKEHAKHHGFFGLFYN